MKKTTLLAGLLVLGLTACSVNVPAPSTTPPAVASVPAPSSVAPVSSSNTASDSEPTDRIDDAELIIENEGVGYADDSSNSVREAQDSHYPLSTINSQLTEPPPALAQQQTPPQTQDPSPPPQAPVAEQPAPQPTPQPDPAPPPPAPASEPPPPAVPQTAYDAPYNVGTITADAASYGASLGMTWNDALTKDNSSWEAPISTSPVLSGENLRTTIQTSINRVLAIQEDNGYQAGEFHFRLYMEANGTEYTLFFLMG